MPPAIVLPAASKTLPPAIVLPAGQKNDAISHRFTSKPAKRCHQPSFYQPASKRMPPALVLLSSQQNDATSHRFTSRPATRCHQPSFYQPASTTLPPLPREFLRANIVLWGLFCSTRIPIFSFKRVGGSASHINMWIGAPVVAPCAPIAMYLRVD